MSKDSHGEGVKDGIKGEESAIRSIFDNDYERGTKEGQGIKDGMHDSKGSVREFFDKDYARGTRIGEGLQSSLPRRESKGYSGGNGDGGTKESEQGASQKFLALAGGLTSSLGLISAIALIIMLCGRASSGWLVIIALWGLVAGIVGLWGVGATIVAGYGPSLLYMVVFGAGMIQITKNIIPISTPVYGIGSIILIILSIVFLSKAADK